MIRLVEERDVKQIISIYNEYGENVDVDYINSLVGNNMEYIYVISNEDIIDGFIICENDGKYIRVKRLLVKELQDKENMIKSLFKHLNFNANTDVLIEIKENNFEMLKLLQSIEFNIFNKSDDIITLKRNFKTIIASEEEIFNYFEQDDEFKKILIDQINEPLWVGAKHLYKRLINNEQSGRVFLIYDKERAHIVSFATLSNFDEIENDNFKPWIGSVYTFRPYRGNRYSEKLIKYILRIAKNENCDFVYLSSDNVGMYEKFGFELLGIMKTVRGNETQVFRYDLKNIK